MVLGIETSCDETAAAVVADGRRVLSSVVAGQHEIHAEYGGVVPELASRAHAERIGPVVGEALRLAGVSPRELHAVAVGHRPGLIGALLVGLSAAKAMAWSLGLPLVGVDHVHAHLWAGLLDAAHDEAELYPALGFVVSGGHTTLYRCASPVGLVRLGASIDDAMGEAFDKAAAILGLPHPGGPNLDRLASAAGADDRAEAFPVSRLGGESLDFSFSGLKTALLYAVRGVPGREWMQREPPPPLTDERRRDLAASFQRAACKAATVKLDRALQRWEGERPRSLMVGGGVTANSRLRRELAQLAAAHGLPLILPEPRFCVDNAAMIAGLGERALLERGPDDLTLAAVPTTAC